MHVGEAAKQKEGRLNLEEILSVSGGTIGVGVNDKCHKKGTFRSLGKGKNCSENCGNCWHLKFNNGFFCDA